MFKLELKKKKFNKVEEGGDAPASSESDAGGVDQEEEFFAELIEDPNGGFELLKEEPKEEEPPKEEEEEPVEAPTESEQGEAEKGEKAEAKPKDEQQTTIEPKGEEQEEAQQAQQTEAEEVSVEKWMEELAGRYQVNEEDADLLVTEPEQVLPKMAANIHAQVMADVLKAVNGLLPQAFGQLVQAQPQVIKSALGAYETQTSAKEAFYESNPELVGKEKLVLEVAKTVAQNFPDLSLEEQLAKTGQVAKSMLGLESEVVGDSKKEEPQRPFIPASGGGNMKQTSTEKSAWEEFI